ncbi:hypothetical protein [Silvanigrella sp.]|jgi:hypothetical protein|uniref:hypothetical protein n=1 Tax=Silvanigrella sp. TaxID=2024976 RepID=UPI0037C995EF
MEISKYISKIFIVFLFFIFTLQAKAIMIIKHNLTASENENSLSYEYAILKLILDKSKERYGEYQLVKSIKMSQTRAFHELSKVDSEVNVIASMTSIERENKSSPIRICLFKGLLGVRIPIVLNSEKERIEKIKTYSDLKKLKVGQVFDWPDKKILEANKMSVIKTTVYTGLFPMLVLKRFDIFPLGALEVYQIEKEHEAKYKLNVIENWAIAYPTGYYFFVNQKNKILEERLNYGFMNAIKDGSFDEIFNKYNSNFLKIANLENRKIFKLKNPILPKTTVFKDKNIWHPLIMKEFSEF